MGFWSLLRQYVTRDVITILFLGISSGLPLLLVFGTLSVWLREAGIERATIGFLSWAGLSYGFKFIWAPLIDSLSIPWLTARLGRRRSWLLLSQLVVAAALLLMASMDPLASQLQFIWLIIGAVILGFASATQDIVIDAYRIDIAPAEYQPLLAGTAVAGYRVGMLLAGAGVLELSDLFGKSDQYVASAWQLSYMVMALMMFAAVLLTLNIREPSKTITSQQMVSDSHGLLLCHFFAMVAVFIGSFIVYKYIVTVPNWPVSVGTQGIIHFFYEAIRFCISLTLGVVCGVFLARLGLIETELFVRIYISPFSDFFTRYGRLSIYLLLLICFYRVADIVMGVMAKVFYTDMGYSKAAIGRISFGFGLMMSLLGGIAGGMLALRYGVLKLLLLGAILAAVSNLVFVYLASLPNPSLVALTMAIIVDNLSGGLAGAVAVAFISVLVNRQFGASQYAAFTSITYLIPKLISGYSGQVVDVVGYSAFFIITAAIGVPVILLILKLWQPLQDILTSKAQHRH